MSTFDRRGFIGGLAAAGMAAALRPHRALGQPVRGPRLPATPARRASGLTFPRVHRSITEEPQLQELADLVRGFATDGHVAPHNLHNCAHGFGMAGIGVLPGNGTRFFTWHREYLGELSKVLAEHQRTLPSWAPWEKIPQPFLSRGMTSPRAPRLGWQNAFNLWSHELIGYWPNLDVMGSQLSWSAHLQVHIACGGDMALVQRAPHAPIFWPWHAFVDDLYADRLAVVAARPPGNGPLPPPAQWPWLDQGPDDPSLPPQSGDAIAQTPWCYGLTRDEAAQRIRDAGLVVGGDLKTMGAADYVCGQFPRPFTRQKQNAGVVQIWGMVSETLIPNQTSAVGFDATLLGGLFRLTLDKGSVTYGRQLGVAVRGTVTLTSVAAPTFSVALKDAELALEASKCPDVMETSHVTAGPEGLTSHGWYDLKGHATVEIRWGGIQLAIPDAKLALRPDGTLAFTGNDADLLGCRHSVGEGSKLAADQLQLAGSLRCGDAVIGSSVLEASPAGIKGGGKLAAFGHDFDLRYGMAGGALTAAATWTASGTGWRALPGVAGVEVQVVNPRLAIDVTGANATGRMTASLSVDRVDARTTATGPDGKPLAAASLNPRPIAVAAGGSVPLPLPGLPAPAPIPGPPDGDVFCDAGCSELSAFGLRPLVTSGTGFGDAGGSLQFTDGSHGECRIKQEKRGIHGPLHDKCKATTACPQGDERYQEGGTWKCRKAPKAASVPKLPESVSIPITDLIR